MSPNHGRFVNVMAGRVPTKGVFDRLEIARGHASSASSAHFRTCWHEWL